MSQWTWQFVSALARQSIELHVVSQRFGEGTIPAGIACHIVPPSKSRLVFAEAAANIVRRLELDVVHDMGTGWHFDIFQPHGGSYAAWLGRRLDIYPRWLRALKRPIDAMTPRHRDFARHSRTQYEAARAPDKTIIALSNTVADDFVHLNKIRPKQIDVIYNGVDCRRFSPEHRTRFLQPVRRRLGIDDETLVLMLAAHNLRLKGAPELLKVVAQLVQNRKRIHVLIAGGKHLVRWQRRSQRLGLAEHVSFLGTVADLVPYYSAADVYVHPTYYDPCSLVLLEAAASGLPIVTTRRCNGAAELFRDGDNILTVNDPSEHDAIYERVEALVDQRLRTSLGQSARKVALQHPFEKNVADIMRLYDVRPGRRMAA
jgi:UDP-glucose:(heptosyl)LPS alpha-1,3-glucosyltransferase